MKKLMTVAVLLSLTAFASLAQADGFSSETDFLNQPDGCRVFDMVVSPDCDYDYAPKRCEAAQNALKSVDDQIEALNISYSCDRIHTGNFWARLLDETMMNSSSYDGYKLDVTASFRTDAPADSQEHSSADVQTASPEACQDALSALGSLAQQGLKLTTACAGAELRVQLQ